MIMHNKKIRANASYILIAFAAILCWVAGCCIALYIHGARLAVCAQEVRLAPYNPAYAEYVPLLAHRAPCTDDIPPPPAIAARAAVVMDAVSGALLFEKNPDQSIPPASLTKLVAIYTAMQAVERGDIHLSDIISPPQESWAVNMPPGSSLMFLGKNQRVSVEELILGMSVVSGNDAAIALAIHTAGSVAAFVQQMNETVAALGLQNTHFEEPSGLSEYNRTTARDFARFAAAYVRKYPEHLAQFHSVRELSYPQPHNALTPQRAIRQSATNTLLDHLEGCDGIKTGFIYESGFNIALTAQRNGARFIAVILGGAGRNSREGKAIRETNGKALMEWAFANFSTVYAQHFPLHVPAIPVLGAKQAADKTAFIPLLADAAGNNAAFTVPLREKNGLQQKHDDIYSRILLPTVFYAPIAAGQKIGRVQFVRQTGGDDQILAEFPLITDRAVEQDSMLRLKYDSLAFKFRQLFR